MTFIDYATIEETTTFDLAELLALLNEEEGA